MENASVTDKKPGAKRANPDPMAGIGYWESPGNSPKQKRKALEVKAVNSINMQVFLAALEKHKDMGEDSEVDIVGDNGGRGL